MKLDGMVQMRKNAKKDGVRRTPGTGEPHYATTPVVADAFRMLYARCVVVFASQCEARAGMADRAPYRGAATASRQVCEIVLAWSNLSFNFHLLHF
ncbi:hypothetical protein [Paraburkholderia sp. J10-1]|uniref:hypothetical protein n=1 Tax=Paraburkholderia sp. J10-1 TaxID=2805430 RepID=UPI002AB7491B|nr:hypothetical protein [Paraburkholderia sp. J10-1]